MSEAQRLALALQGRMSEVAHPGQPLPSGLRQFGIGQQDVMRRLAALEARTRHTVWNTVPTLTFDPEDAAYALADRSRARGVKLTMVVPPRTVRFHPLLTSFAPQVLLGPAVLRSIIVDGELAVIAGPETVDGATTAWLASDGEFLKSALMLWHTIVAESWPALAEGVEPPLNPRQCEVARAVCLGKTDAAIARQLRISERTLARDVAAIMEVTGGGSRAEAVLNMLGRGRQSRT